MNIKINETGEIKTLSIIDSKTGVNWAQDLIGNAGAFSEGEFEWSEDDNAYLADEVTYEWWAEYIADSQTTQDEVDDLAETLNMSADEINMLIANNLHGDYEMHRKDAIGTMAQILEAAARKRVEEDADLAEHADLLLEYQWDNEADHIMWLATADKDEIMSWIASVRTSA